MSEASHYRDMCEVLRKNAIKYASLGMTVGQFEALSDASKAEADLTDGAEIRRRAGMADEHDRLILAYSRFSPSVPGCSHPSTAVRLGHVDNFRS